METTHNSVKVKLGIKVMKSVESLIVWEVTVGKGSECHLTFVRGRLHIAEYEYINQIFRLVFSISLKSDEGNENGLRKIVLICDC